MEAADLQYYIRCTCQSISAISVAECTFNATVHLAVGIRSREGSALVLEQLQQPLSFLNSDDATLEETARWLMPDGSAVILLKALGSFRQRFDVRAFPFETLVCAFEVTSSVPSSAPTAVEGKGRAPTVALASTEHPESGHTYGKHVIFVERNFSCVDMFTFLGSSHSTSKSAVAESASGKVYDVIEFRYAMRRRPQFYVWNILLPTCTLSALNFVVFRLSPEDFADRLSVTLTLLLTMAAYKFTVADKLPPVSYLTLADIYVLLCFALTVTITLENAWATDQSAAADRTACLVIGAVWLAANALVVMFCIWKYLQGRAKTVGRWAARSSRIQAT